MKKRPPAATATRTLAHVPAPLFEKKKIINETGVDCL